MVRQVLLLEHSHHSANLLVEEVAGMLAGTADVVLVGCIASLVVALAVPVHEHLHDPAYVSMRSAKGVKMECQLTGYGAVTCPGTWPGT
jgi:hypothetical protein